MPARLKLNSLILVVLVPLFVFTIHNLARLRVPPFGLDPCDAVMHFAVFTMLLGLGCALRAFRPLTENHLSNEQNCYVLRSQYAVTLSASLAFLAYVVVLGRHPSMWIRAVWRTQLLEWLGVFGCIAVAMKLATLTTQSTRRQTTPLSRTRAILACVLAVVAMFFSPEYGLGAGSESSHILTVIIGALIILIPVHYLLPVLVPDEHGAKMSHQALFSTINERLSLLSGVLIGGLLFWIDAHRETWRPFLPTLKLVGPLMALLVIYAFLADELGLHRGGAQIK